MKIIIDAMGGDNAPAAIVAGAVDALARYSDVELVLVGRQEDIQRCLDGAQYDSARLSVVNATQVIEMAEHPANAVRRKKDSSMVVGMRMLADGEAGAFITAGSTGAALAGGMLVVRRIKGVKRPALAPVLPTMGENGVLLIDCGANADCKPGNLAQFAVMGSAYMSRVMGIRNPRVGLMNNGAEEEKGSMLYVAAHKLLKEAPVNFAGNCEGRDVVSGRFDVVVCDGFTGNVYLKGLEGVSGMILGKLKASLMSSFKSKMGAVLCKGSFAALKKELDYTEYGGALLLGVNGGVIKTHGSSDARAIVNTVRQAREFIMSGVVDAIKEEISSYKLDEADE